MSRRTIGLLVVLALGVLLTPLAPTAQPPVKVHRIGVLVSTSPNLAASLTPQAIV
jgi:hypothetical protein